MPQEQRPLPAEPLGNALQGNANIKMRPVANDARTLRDLCSTLNNPAITGAQIPADEKAAIDQLVAANQAIPSDVPGASPVKESTSIVHGAGQSLNQIPNTPALTIKPQLTKVFLTGRAGGADEVASKTGAYVINLRTLIESQMRDNFGATPTPALVKEFQAWSTGIVSAQYPQTLTRTLLEALIRKSYPTFGTPDYWIGLIFDRVDQVIAQVANRVVITGIDSLANFKALQKAGFAHYHVMLSNISAQNKTLTPDPLSDALDNDVIKKISFQRQGGRLHVVWNDDQPSPSPRFYSLPEFLSEFAEPAVAEGEVEIQ